MSKKTDDFIALRDEMLLSGSIDRMQGYLRLLGHPPSSRATAELAMHQAITGATTLPLPYRKQSKMWLTQRGFTSMDDGEL